MTLSKVAEMTRWLTQALILPALTAVMLSPAWARPHDTTTEATMTIGGIARSYILHLPPAAKEGGPLPLVIVLHGGGANAEAAIDLTGFDAEADAKGFIVAYPDGTGRPKPATEATGRFSWNAGDCCGSAMRQQADDVGFVRALVAKIGEDHAIDPDRIYAAGFSAGGMMAYRLACEASDIFASVAVVSGAILVSSCMPDRPVSVIDIHGTDDRAVPINGTVERESYAQALFPPVWESVAFWAAFDGCRMQPVAAEPVSGVRSRDYRDCRGGTAVRFDVVEDGIHGWPDGSMTPGFAATPRIWQFFADHPRIEQAQSDSSISPASVGLNPQPR